MPAGHTEVLPPESLRQALLKDAGSISMMPDVATRALEISRDPERGLRDFSTIVEQDVGLTTSILRLANSALFAPPRPITSLHRAVAQLGLKQCKNLILAASIDSLIRRLSAEQLFVREELSRHAFVTAVAAYHLNRALELPFGGEEFTAGLIHDVGRVLLAIAAPHEFAQADRLEFADEEATMKNERAVLGTDHCEFGTWFAQHNGLPAELVSVIRSHHAPDPAETHLPLVLLTAAADHMANHLQRPQAGRAYDAAGNLAVWRLDSFVKPGTMDRFHALAPSVLTGTLNDAEALLKLAA
jgi:HD-like signal output (HDOD) protein